MGTGCMSWAQASGSFYGSHQEKVLWILLLVQLEISSMGCDWSFSLSNNANSVFIDLGNSLNRPSGVGFCLHRAVLDIFGWYIRFLPAGIGCSILLFEDLKGSSDCACSRSWRSQAELRGTEASSFLASTGGLPPDSTLARSPIGLRCWCAGHLIGDRSYQDGMSISIYTECRLVSLVSVVAPSNAPSSARVFQSGNSHWIGGPRSHWSSCLQCIHSSRILDHMAAVWFCSSSHIENTSGLLHPRVEIVDVGSEQSPGGLGWRASILVFDPVEVGVHLMSFYCQPYLLGPVFALLLFLNCSPVWSCYFGFIHLELVQFRYCLSPDPDLLVLLGQLVSSSPGSWWPLALIHWWHLGITPARPLDFPVRLDHCHCALSYSEMSFSPVHWFQDHRIDFDVKFHFHLALGFRRFSECS